MPQIILEFLYRLIVTLLILTPSLTAIVVAFTIIYDRDFKKNKTQNEATEKQEEQETYNDP